VEWKASCNGRGEKRERCATVSVADGRVFEGTRCVVTVPLGVLQAGVIAFEPEVTMVMQAAKRMRMGQACRLATVFRKRLWPEKMSFLLTRELLPSVWWTAHPAAARSLIGWVGGPRAAALVDLSEAELRERAISAASKALGVAEPETREQLVGFYTHDWRADQGALGAYSWVPVGGLEASAEMCEPVGGVLFFAGEHTDTTGHWGTVHAALRSGLRAARQILEAGA
jgi:monoamine oxidase